MCCYYYYYYYRTFFLSETRIMQLQKGNETNIRSSVQMHGTN